MMARDTHRVAISNRRLVSLDERGVNLRYKDYRRNGQARYRAMTLSADEFIRRFLLHVLPKGFHRIGHYGLLARAGCRGQRRARQGVDGRPNAGVRSAGSAQQQPVRTPRPIIARRDGACGGRMIIVEVFARRGEPRSPALPDQDLTRRLSLSSRCSIHALEHLVPGAAPTSPRCPQAPAGYHAQVLNRAVECRSSGQAAIISDFRLSAIFRKPSPAKGAATPNPHRRPSAHRLPVRSFFGGFRTPAPHRVDRSRRAGIRNPSRPESRPSGWHIPASWFHVSIVCEIMDG
jgi:hypothetical protein